MRIVHYNCLKTYERISIMPIRSTYNKLSLLYCQFNLWHAKKWRKTNKNKKQNQQEEYVYLFFNRYQWQIRIDKSIIMGVSIYLHPNYYSSFNSFFFFIIHFLYDIRIMTRIVHQLLLLPHSTTTNPTTQDYLYQVYIYIVNFIVSTLLYVSKE